MQLDLALSYIILGDEFNVVVCQFLYSSILLKTNEPIHERCLQVSSVWLYSILKHFHNSLPFFVINSSCWITGKLYIVLPCVDDSHTRHSRHHTLPYYITFLFVSFSTYWVRSCHSEMYHVGKRLHPFFGRQFSINLCVCLLYPPKCADIFQMSSAPNCLNDISFSSHENITRRQLHFFCKSH